MKKSATFLFLFSLVFSLNAQSLNNFNEKKTSQDSENPRIELQNHHRQHVQQVNQQFNGDLKTQTASIQLDSIIDEYADSLGAVLENDFKFSFMYNTNGNPITEYQSNWGANNWDLERRIENTFNASGQLTVEVYSDWYSNQWEYDYKYEYVWGANNRVSSETDYYWNGNQWENAYKYTYTYDANNNLIEELESNWNNGAWEQTDKNTLMYNSNNQLTEEIDYSWDGAQWINDWKTVYTYDNNDFLIKEENFNWNNTWINSWKDEYVNNASGRPTEIIESSWMGNYWSINGKNELTYDAKGNVTQTIYSNWYSGTYHLSQKEEFTYDLSYGPSDMWLPLWFDEFYNKVVDASYYEYDNGNWEMSQHINLYYTAIPFNVPEFALNQLTIYPNPTHDFLFLKGNVNQAISVSVSDLTGKDVISNTECSNQVIDLSNFPSGIYFVKISDGKKVLVKKVVKH